VTPHVKEQRETEKLYTCSPACKSNGAGALKAPHCHMRYLRCVHRDTVCDYIGVNLCVDLNLFWDVFTCPTKMYSVCSRNAYDSKYQDLHPTFVHMCTINKSPNQSSLLALSIFLWQEHVCTFDKHHNSVLRRYNNKNISGLDCMLGRTFAKFECACIHYSYIVGSRHSIAAPAVLVFKVVSVQRWWWYPHVQINCIDHC